MVYIPVIKFSVMLRYSWVEPVLSSFLERLCVLFCFVEMFPPNLELSQHMSPEAIIKFHSQLSTINFILLINVKMPTSIGILTCINRRNTISESFKAK